MAFIITSVAVYLDNNNDVLAAAVDSGGRTPPTLTEAQAIHSTATQRILGCPSHIRAKGSYSKVHYRKIGGDGTKPGDWQLIDANKDLVLNRFRVDKNTDHRQVDYITGLTGRLYKWIDYDDPTFFRRGELRKVEYYTDSSRSTLVLRVKMQYWRQPNGLLMMINNLAVPGDPDFFGRQTDREWFREDGTPHPDKKKSVKRYEGTHPMKEGKRRRENVIDKLVSDVLAMLTVTRAVDPANPTPAEWKSAEDDGNAYLKKHRDGLDDYRKSGDLSLKVPPAIPNITDDTEPWLDNSVVGYGWTGPTIRDEILNALVEVNAP